MGLTRLAVHRPITITMLILALVLLGAMAYTRLQVARFPRMNFPVVTIRVAYPGASAQDVEQLVSKPVELAMNGLPGVTDIFSTSREGQAMVSVRLHEDADANRAALDIERKLASIRGRLPADINPPDVIKADVSGFPIMNIALSGPFPLDQLYALASDTIAPRLQSVPGVAQVNVVGGLQREVQVLVDPVKLQAYGLTLQQVQSALAQDNLTSPGGTVQQGPSQFSVRTSALFTRLDQFNEVVLASGPSGTAYLKDVAEVKDTYARQGSILRYNGRTSVGLSILQQSDANTVEVVERVRGEAERLQRAVPRGVVFNVTNDASRFTRAALDAVQTDLALAIVLCGLVLLVFLHAWRNTVVVMLAIPTSLVSTLLVMYFLGFTLNTISLMALALVIGILVDDSIVVLENIHRHRKLGEEPVLAALNGRSEIGTAAIAITLTDVVVFVPIAFMSGSLGQMFREFGLTIVAATLFSLFISFTLTPMLAAHWLTAENVEAFNRRVRRGLLAPFQGFGDRWEAGLDRVREAYRRTLAWALGHRPLVLLGAAASLAIALAFIPLNLLGSEYAPTEDDNQINLQVQMPPGTSLEATSRAMAEMEQRLTQLPEVKNIFSSVGGGGGFMASAAQAAFGSMAVQLVDKSERSRSVGDVLEEARSIGRSIPGMTLSGTIQSTFGGGGAPINIRVLGDDLTTLTGIVEQVKGIVRATPGTTDVRQEEGEGVPEVQVALDRSRMAAWGITASQVAGVLRTAVQGSVVSQFDRPDGTQTDVRLKLANADAMTPLQLAALPVPAPATGEMVRLDQIATLRQATGPSQINRANLRRRMTINANVVGRSLGDVARDIQAQVRQLSLPAGYQVVFVGQVDRLYQGFNSLMQALVLSVVLIYMLLAALYENWLHPFAIMFSLPLALVGAFSGLLITGNTLNMFSMIGMILLMGLVAKNAILLVDYTNTLRQRGMARREALLEAGPTRLRPILMTTFTMVFALIPLALKLEAGAESRSPMAVTILGGLLSSMLLTLVVVPVVYTVLEDIPGWFRALGRVPRRVAARRPAAQAPPFATGVPRVQDVASSDLAHKP